MVSSICYLAFHLRMKQRYALYCGAQGAGPTYLVLSCDFVQFLLASTLVERLRVLGRTVVVVHAAFTHNVRHLLQQESIVALNLGVSVLLRR